MLDISFSTAPVDPHFLLEQVPVIVGQIKGGRQVVMVLAVAGVEYAHVFAVEENRLRGMALSAKRQPGSDPMRHRVSHIVVVEQVAGIPRSEERRVGKGCRARRGA